jgi:hypothetical protein
MTWLGCKQNPFGGDGGIQEGTRPACLADDTGAEEHVVVQRDASGNSADSVTEAPIVVIHEDQNINVRVGMALASSF